MKLYRSFLVRCWLISERSDERSVFDVEHIQTGERKKTSSLHEAEEWMLSRVPHIENRPLEDEVLNPKK